jgi:hypothetical protein
MRRMTKWFLFQSFIWVSTIDRIKKRVKKVEKCAKKIKVNYFEVKKGGNILWGKFPGKEGDMRRRLELSPRALALIRQVRAHYLIKFLISHFEIYWTKCPWQCQQIYTIFCAINCLYFLLYNVIIFYYIGTTLKAAVRSSKRTKPIALT